MPPSCDLRPLTFSKMKAVGFLSLILSDIKPVIDFGKMMAIGVGLNFLVSFIFIPSVLAIKNISSNRNTNFVPFFYNNIYFNIFIIEGFE